MIFIFPLRTYFILNTILYLSNIQWYVYLIVGFCFKKKKEVRRDAKKKGEKYKF